MISVVLHMSWGSNEKCSFTHQILAQKPFPDLLPSLNTIESMPPGGLIAGRAPQALENRGMEVIQEQKDVLMERHGGSTQPWLCSRRARPQWVPEAEKK